MRSRLRLLRVVLTLGGLALAPTPAFAALSASEMFDLYGVVLAAEQVDIGSRSTREARTAFLVRVVRHRLLGPSRLQPHARPALVREERGRGAPLSDDQIALCGSRDAWDLVAASASGFGDVSNQVTIVVP